MTPPNAAPPKIEPIYGHEVGFETNAFRPGDGSEQVGTHHTGIEGLNVGHFGGNLGEIRSTPHHRTHDARQAAAHHASEDMAGEGGARRAVAISPA